MLFRRNEARVCLMSMQATEDVKPVNENHRATTEFKTESAALVTPVELISLLQYR